jgi:uncharacterized glyoxalase superfamily protein PhnB
MKSNLYEIIPVLPSTEISEDVLFYERLGFYLEESYGDINHAVNSGYAVLAGNNLHIHLQFQYEKDMPPKNATTQIRIHVADIDLIHKELTAEGISVKHPVETAWKTREFVLKDRNGNRLIYYMDV